MTLVEGLARALKGDDDAPPALVMSQSDLAKYAGVSRQTVTANKARLVFDTDFGGVDVIASFRKLKAETDPLKVAAAERAADATPAGPSLADAQRRKLEAQAKNAELDLQERQGRVVRTDHVTGAMVEAARRIGARLDQMTFMADELDAAARSGGPDAIRQILKVKVRDMRTALAETMTLWQGEAETDDTE